MALSQSFLDKVDAIETRLKMEPGSLSKIMSFETGGSFDPAERNRAGSGATGFIQFTRDTAKGLGTSTDALAKMSAEDQLEYVEKYLTPYKGKIGTLENAYMSVLYPKAIGKPTWYPLFHQGTKAYEQNAGLDRDKKGMVTKADAVARVLGNRDAPAPTMVAQAPRREDAPQVQAPGFTAQEGSTAPEPTPIPHGGTDWARALFGDQGGTTQGSMSPGQDWARLLFG